MRVGHSSEGLFAHGHLEQHARIYVPSTLPASRRFLWNYVPTSLFSVASGLVVNTLSRRPLQTRRSVLIGETVAKPGALESI